MPNAGTATNHFEKTFILQCNNPVLKLLSRSFQDDKSLWLTAMTYGL